MKRPLSVFLAFSLLALSGFHLWDSQRPDKKCGFFEERAESRDPFDIHLLRACLIAKADMRERSGMQQVIAMDLLARLEALEHETRSLAVSRLADGRNPYPTRTGYFLMAREVGLPRALFLHAEMHRRTAETGQ